MIAELPCTCVIAGVWRHVDPHCPRHRTRYLNAAPADAPGGFDWPCERRDAHRPHRAKIEVRDLAAVAPRFVDGPECPGVKAHPATMIGRAS